METDCVLGGDSELLTAALCMDSESLSRALRYYDQCIMRMEETSTVSIGNVESNERGSGARYNGNKTKWSLMPTYLLKEVVDVWEYGAQKYAAWNWAKGMPWSVPYECIVRHLYRWYWLGERNDSESGKSHLAHIICNVMMLMHYESKYQEGDDRPTEFRE